MHQNTRIQSIGNTFYAQYRWLLQHRLSKNVLTGQGITMDSKPLANEDGPDEAIC